MVLVVGVDNPRVPRLFVHSNVEFDLLELVVVDVPLSSERRKAPPTDLLLNRCWFVGLATNTSSDVSRATSLGGGVAENSNFWFVASSFRRCANTRDACKVHLMVCN